MRSTMSHNERYLTARRERDSALRPYSSDPTGFQAPAAPVAVEQFS